MRLYVAFWIGVAMFFLGWIPLGLAPSAWTAAIVIVGWTVAVITSTVALWRVGEARHRRWLAERQ